MTDALTIRPATPADAPVCARLSQEAFGLPASAPDPLPDPAAPHRRTVVAERAGSVLAKASDRPFLSWYGGRRVPTSGIAGVAVATEARGRGVAGTLLREVLRAAHARGAVISTLYPSAPGIYRGLGYGHAGAYTWARVPTASLAAVRPTGRGAAGADEPEIRLERVDRSAWPELLACYTAWACQHDGPLSRDDAGYPAPLDDLDAHRVTVARDGTGQVVGYAAWQRRDGRGSGPDVAVSNLVATHAAAARALLASLGSHSSAAPRTDLLGAGEDLLPWYLPSTDVEILDRRPYLVAILDVVGALEARGWAPAVRTQTTFAVTGLPVPGQDGTYRVALADGAARVERVGRDRGAGGGGGGRPAARLTAEGLGMLYAGCPAATLRLAGHLGPGDSGGSAGAEDAGIDALGLAAGGRSFAIRDYF